MMKKLEKIVIRLTFLLAVIFCLELEVYSDYPSSACSMELSSASNLVDHGLNSEDDTFDDHQMNQCQEFGWVTEPMFRLPNSQKLFLMQNYSFLKGQPPKYSNNWI
jgi:hypothetical protein